MSAEGEPSGAPGHTSQIHLSVSRFLSSHALYFYLNDYCVFEYGFCIGEGAVRIMLHDNIKGPAL